MPMVNTRSMTRHILKLVILCSFIFLISCQTGTCPNCVNPKPEYYNMAKAKEVKRMARHNAKATATGQTLSSDPAREKKKEKAMKHKGRRNKVENVNDPILNK
jgi:hypothetical protein